MNRTLAPNLTVIILAFNEAVHIGRAIASINKLHAEVIVVDAFSTDATATIAREGGAKVVEHTFVNYAQQFQWALDHLHIATDWVMRLDADEVLTDELVAEMLERLPRLPAEVTGINLNRRHIFLGRWIKHGGRYPLTLLRIWRRGAARIEQRWMDEHMVLTRGGLLTFSHDFCDVNLNDLSYFTEKHNKYATREAVDVLQQRYRLVESDRGIKAGSAPAQASRKRVIKEDFYNHLPFWVGPAAYFLFRYILQAGFLDGRAGTVYHVLQGFWYRFLVGAKVQEYDAVLQSLPDKAARRRALEQLTGLSLSPTDLRPAEATAHGYDLPFRTTPEM